MTYASILSPWGGYGKPVVVVGRPAESVNEDTSMLSKPVSAQLTFVLALVMLMAWAGHSAALGPGVSQGAWNGEDRAHAHSHSMGISVCARCADHYHSTLTADHVHETPYLTTLLTVSTLPERPQPIEATRYAIPPSPIFLIERPPRPRFAL
jgi:hypothetical protein